MREIKFKVVWNNEVSNEAFTIGEFTEGIEMSFKDGETLPFKDIDWATDKVEYIQYTGLKDKNGKEIFEGDIMYYDTRIGNMKIVWEYSCYKLVSDNVYNNKKEEYERRSIGNVHRLKIIGNIYSNPELLAKQ